MRPTSQNFMSYIQSEDADIVVYVEEDLPVFLSSYDDEVIPQLKEEAKVATKILVTRKNELKELLPKKIYRPVDDGTNAIFNKNDVVRH